MIPVGMFWERRRRGQRSLPTLDFNSAKQRSSVAFVLSFVVVFLMLSAVGSYRAYEFTDSVQFCGELCHTRDASRSSRHTSNRPMREWLAWNVT